MADLRGGAADDTTLPSGGADAFGGAREVAENAAVGCCRDGRPLPWLRPADDDAVDIDAARADTLRGGGGVGSHGWCGANLPAVRKDVVGA